MKPSTDADAAMTRRQLLTLAIMSGLGMSFLGQHTLAIASSSKQELYLASQRDPERVLHLTRGGHEIQAKYAQGRVLYLRGYTEICNLCRDTHVPQKDGVRQIDLAVLDALWQIQTGLQRAGFPALIVINSGFRTEVTNLEAGGVIDSFHLRGSAIDFYVPGTSVVELFSWLRKHHSSGGLGLYAPTDKRKIGWIHLDSGPKRIWQG